MYIRTCIDRLVLVALSAQPPGVNELCVCVCVCTKLRTPGEEDSRPALDHPDGAS
jgi:hypothetical protein